MGRGHFNFRVPIISLKRVQLDNRHVKFGVLIDIDEYYRVHDRPPPEGMCLRSGGLFNFGEITDNILGIVQSRDIVTQQQQKQQPFYGPLSGTTRVSRYQKKHSPIHHPDHHPIFISCPSTTIHSILPVHITCLAIFCTTSLHVLFGLPLGLEPSTSYSIHFFTQSVSSFRSTCSYHRNMFCCSINIISSIPSLSLNSLLGTLSFTLTQ